MSLTVAPETMEWFDYAELGEVEQTITPHRQGRVWFMATYWFARFYQPNGQIEALPGTSVRVIGRQGLTLLVMPVDEDGIQPQMVMGDRAETHRYSWLIRFASKVLKYFLLGLFGVSIACLLSAVLGAFSVVGILMSFLEQWLVRVTVVVVCLLATVVVSESMR